MTLRIGAERFTPISADMALSHKAPRDRRAALSALTAPAHARLDEAMRGAGFFATPVLYARYLQITHQARRALEAALAPLRLLPADAYELTASLEADLADLGTAPLGAAPPVSFARGGGWGCLYVLQGSNLGALQLRGWAQPLGFDGAHGARHLALQAQRARHWRGFVARLNAQSFSPAEEQECAAGALAAFAHFTAAMPGLARPQHRTLDPA